MPVKNQIKTLAKKCPFCGGMKLDYKNPDLLRKFMSDLAKIYSRRRTGCCAKHQRALSIAIKRARHLALLPFCGKHLYLEEKA